MTLREHAVATDEGAALADQVASEPTAASTGTTDFVSSQLTRFNRRGVIRAGVVGDATSERTAVGEPSELAVLRDLLLLLDTPSRLDIETDTGRYHLVFTGALDVAVSCGPPDPDLDAWLDQISQSHRTEVNR